MGILRQSAKLRSQMVSGPPCMIHNDLNSFELSILQGVQPVGIPTFSPNSYFCPTFCFYSYFLTKFLLLQRFRTKTTILLNKDLSSAQILRIYFHIWPNNKNVGIFVFFDKVLFHLTRFCLHILSKINHIQVNTT